eukprot:3626784-Rhodomonas_salina.1
MKNHSNANRPAPRTGARAAHDAHAHTARLEEGHRLRRRLRRRALLATRQHHRRPAAPLAEGRYDQQ